MSDSTRRLRSSAWFTGPEYYNFARRAWMRSQGFSHDVFEDRPIIGICNSWSELNNCHAGLKDVAQAVKRGVTRAGGVALEFPVISLGEMLMKPTAMQFRNLMSMDVEECIRANPLDGVVLLGGCDKTVPAMIMGAASANIPSAVVTTGPMLAGVWRRQSLGSGTDGRKLFDLYRAGKLSDEELDEVEGCIARTAGHCTVMGTASTMACVAEALGMTLPGCASIPAPDARRLALAEETGQRIVSMVDEQLTPARVITRESLENAVTAVMALGGSTNAVVHLLAIAGRLGIPLTLEDFDRISRRTPYLVNLKPSGSYVMEDFFAAGGLAAALRRIPDLLHRECITVSGGTLGQNIESAVCFDDDVIRPADQPLSPEGGIAVLRGNLCPRGALIKQSAATPGLLVHTGPAYVFEDHEEMLAKIDSEDLPVDRNSVLVMKNGGPKGAPGFPEWGQIPMPRKLLRQGITDMVRVSDSRMSGTSFGTVVLHVAPESAAGGPLAQVQTGDPIELNVPARTLTLQVSDRLLDDRRAQCKPDRKYYTRGYGRLFVDHVTQADEGCDFDFLRAADSSSTAER
ncbi:MAG TPA: IlvD/Edd family dehydratase [Bryobacteraceae bacterium]|nr:IlvD/Edd family dehydratase [Bryobacteraceae bacterium]